MQTGIQHYVDRINQGDVAPAIDRVGNTITDGHHRYIAGKIAGELPKSKPGVMTSSKKSRLKPILEVNVDPVDWGNR